MPAWFHAATFVYFATNVFNGWVTLKLGAPAPASALLIFGLLGGFIEHISPYYPKVFIPAFWEKLLFRVPTIVGYMWLALWMNMAWYVIAAFTLHAIVFLRQSALTSMELRYHVEHVLGTHVSGAAGMTILLLLKSGHLPALRAILMP